MISLQTKQSNDVKTDEVESTLYPTGSLMRFLIIK